MDGAVAPLAKAGWLGFPGRQIHIGADAPAHFIGPAQGSLARLKLAIGDDYNIRIALGLLRAQGLR